jgi:hypothetical protein
LPRLKTTLNNRWIVAGLSLLALGLTARAFLAPAPGSGPAPVRPAALAAVVPGAEAAPALAESAPAAPPSASARDPFAARPRVFSGPPIVDTAHLSALWTENGETLALVNGRILRPGDTVGRMTIESATQEGIWVAHPPGRDFIALGGTFVLSTPATGPAVAAIP